MQKASQRSCVLFFIILACGSMVANAEPILQGSPWSLSDFAGYPLVNINNPVAPLPTRLGNGGPFNIVLVGNSAIHFPTFCVESGEYINLGSNYYYTIDPGAIKGGVDTQDLIDNSTKLLYGTFLTGGLDSIPSITFSYASSNNMADLQTAIWYLEGEVGTPTGLALQLANWAKDNAGTNTYNVMALNLWGDANHTQLKQSQLIWVPEPSFVLLLALGVGAVGLLARRWTEK